MPRWLDRLTTRAASGETRALPGAGAGMGNTISAPPTPKGGVQASTRPVSYSGPGTPLLPSWDGRAAIEGYYQSVWVQRTLGAIAETVAALPFVAGMNPDDPSATNPNAPLARLLGPATPQAPGGPHNGTSSQAFLQWSIIQKLATGKMAWEYQVDPVAKGPTGQPAIVGLWPLVSYLLNPFPTSGGSDWFGGFRYQLPTGTIDLKPERVFYAWKKSQRDWRQPESYLEAAALPISISVAIERYSWALLQNGLVATHVVTAAPLEEPDMRRSWEEQFLSNFTGYNQAGKPIFAYADVENGKVTDAFNIQSIAQTSQQAELLALALWVKNEILVATGVPESLIGNASQRIFANADSEYRSFWTTRVINIVAELQDDVNTQLAPLLGPEVGWFDLSRVVALQPPTPFAQPQLTDLLAAGIMDVPEAQQQLGVSDSGFIDTSDAPIGEESSTGTSVSGKASAPMPEQRGAQMWDTSRPVLRGWEWEKRQINTTTLRTGIWRPIFKRERIVVRKAEAPTEVGASRPDAEATGGIVVHDTRGFDRAEAILATVTSLREKRTPNTAEASSTHVPVGPGELWHDPTIHLPDYIEHVANAFRAKGMPESEAIAQAVGVVRDWAEGKTAHGHVHPDVQAAAVKAIAEWDALKASHNKSKRAVAEFGPGGAGSTYAGVGNDASGAGLLLPVAEPVKPKPREAELIGPHRYTPNVRDAKHCAKCGKGPLAKVHKDWASVKQATPQRSSVAAVEALLGRPVESRHRGPDHVHVPTGHANTPVRKRQAMKAAHKAALAGYEAAFTGPMRDLFAKQEKSALVRLTGRRGRQMIKRAVESLEARATSQPGPPDPTTAASEPASPQPATSVDPAALFDSAFWSQKTIDALIPGYDKVAEGSTAAVRAQLGPAVTEEVHSLGAAQIKAALRARAATVAAQVSSTTYQAIARELGAGITAGESVPQLADRVKSVFADASDNRATMIARSESGSASNTAQMEYARSLPQGIVAGKSWLAVEDLRTRPTHRLADGQMRPLDMPFIVGGVNMDRPGDPMAPPSETISCRCTTLFVPMSQSHLLLQQPPKDFTYNPQAPTAA